MVDAPEVVKARVGELFGSLAAGYDSVIPYFATFARVLVEQAGLRAGDEVLDLASGRGACLFPQPRRSGPAGT